MRDGGGGGVRPGGIGGERTRATATPDPVAAQLLDRALLGETPRPARDQQGARSFQPPAGSPPVSRAAGA
jgi:hypothetical protein